MSSFVFWNNKGGVGKSTLCFQVACQYARQHPTKKVLIVDLSPQCDSSRMVLGGGYNNGEQKIISLMSTTPIRRTIQGYLNDCLNEVPTGNGWPIHTNYLTQPNQVRNTNTSNLPDNVLLLLRRLRPRTHRTAYRFDATTSCSRRKNAVRPPILHQNSGSILCTKTR